MSFSLGKTAAPTKVGKQSSQKAALPIAAHVVAQRPALGAAALVSGPATPLAQPAGGFMVSPIAFGPPPSSATVG